MVSSETGEARLAGALNTIPDRVARLHVGGQEYAIALTGNHVANQALGVAVAIDLGRVD